MHRLDDFLIDRVFQPVSDRLARWISCYGIAAFLLTGAILGTIIACVVQRQWFTLASSWWMPLLCVTAYWLDALPITSAPFVTRPRFFAARLNGLFFICVVVTVFFWIDSVLEQLWDISFVASQVAVFFLSCRKNPPPKREAKLPARAVPQT